MRRFLEVKGISLRPFWPIASKNWNARELLQDLVIPKMGQNSLIHLRRQSLDLVLVLFEIITARGRTDLDTAGPKGVFKGA